MFVTEIADDYRDGCKKSLCNVKIHSKNFDTKGKENEANANGDRVYSIITEIFPYVVTFSFEHKELVADI